jgi:hypothetical protein
MSSGKFTDLKLRDYTDKSFVVQGKTHNYRVDLKTLGGKYNPNLEGGPGWVFELSRKKDIVNYIEGGKPLVTDEVKIANDKRSDSWVSNSTDRSSFQRSNQSFTSSSPTLLEYSTLLASITSMANDIKRINTAINFLLTPEQKKTLDTIVNSNSENKKDKVVQKTVKKQEIVSEDSEDSDGFDLSEVPVRRILGVRK